MAVFSVSARLFVAAVWLVGGICVIAFVLRIVSIFLAVNSFYIKASVRGFPGGCPRQAFIPLVSRKEGGHGRTPFGARFPSFPLSGRKEGMDSCCQPLCLQLFAESVPTGFACGSGCVPTVRSGDSGFEKCVRFVREGFSRSGRTARGGRRWRSLFRCRLSPRSPCRCLAVAFVSCSVLPLRR